MNKKKTERSEYFSLHFSKIPIFLRFVEFIVLNVPCKYTTDIGRFQRRERVRHLSSKERKKELARNWFSSGNWGREKSAFAFRRKRLSPGRVRRGGEKGGSFQICGAPAIRGVSLPRVSPACMDTAPFYKGFYSFRIPGCRGRGSRHRPVSLLRHPPLKRA